MKCVLNRSIPLVFCMFLFAGPGAMAQTGPDVPCVNCPVMNDPPKPETGLWNNPLDPTGTGFMIEVQGDRMIAFLFIYDEFGEPEWYLASGLLQPPEDSASAAIWTLEADLTRFSGGPCINCPSLPFMAGGSGGTVRFEFQGRNFGRFRIDDGPWENVMVSTYGVAAEVVFPELSDYRIPDLEGSWIFQFDSEELRSFSRPRRLLIPFRLDRAECEAGAMTCYYLLRDRNTTFAGIFPPVTPPEPILIAELKCFGSVDSGPYCQIEFNPLITFEDELSRAPFILPLANIGSQRLHGQQVDAPELESEPLTLKAFRVDHD